MISFWKIQKFVEDGKTFDILFIKESNYDSNQAVVKVDPQILQVLTNIKQKNNTNAIIYIQNTACRFFDRFHIVQCYKCQSFGHRKGSPHCPLNMTTRSTCLYCSQDHLSKDCKFKKTSSNHKCANCKRFNVDPQNDESLNHTTTDHMCPIFQKQIDYVLKNTKGLPGISKNDYPKHVFIT